MTTLIEATVHPNVTLIVVVGALIAAGTVLVLDRSLVRILLGLLLVGNGVSILYMVIAGEAGRPPFVGDTEPSEMSDPLPQAMVLTAIVISLATMGFLLALAYRLWQVAGTDDVPDDAEDARILDLALANETSSTYDPNVTPTTTADESADESAEGSPT